MCSLAGDGLERSLTDARLISLLEIGVAVEEQKARRSARGQSAHQEHGQRGLFLKRNPCTQLVFYTDQVKRAAQLFLFFLKSQDEVRTQKVTKQKGTLEAVNNSVKLLNEMLAYFSPEDSTDGDKELIKVCSP